MKIKVNFIGNTCNYAFWYAKYLQDDNNIEAKCFIEYTTINRDYPWWDDKNISKDNIPPWMLIMPYFKFPGGFFSWSKSNCVLRELQKCDLIHAFGLMSAIWALRSGRPFIYHSYGDIISTPFIQKKFSIKNWIRLIISRIILSKAKKIILSQTLDIDFAIKLNVFQKTKILPLFYDINVFSNTTYRIDDSFALFFSSWDLIFYSPSRHIRLKRQDKVIKCFSRFLKHTTKKVLLILTEWGDLVNENKRLISELGIQKFVKWIPCQTKEGMAQYYQLNNVAVLDEFEDPPIKVSFGGVSRDALSMECILITSIDKSYFLKLHKSLPPILWTDYSENSIFERMLEFSKMSEDERKFFAKKGNEWLQSEHNFLDLKSRYYKEYLEILKN